MDKQTELKRLIYDFNAVIERINKAERIGQKELDKYCDEKFERVSMALNGLIKDASTIANKIEKLTGRPVTGYESLHGINI